MSNSVRRLRLRRIMSRSVQLDSEQRIGRIEIRYVIRTKHVLPAEFDS